VGDAVSLPPAEEASVLFKYDVALLRKEIEKLTGREEFLQDGRFTGTRPEMFRKYVWRREDFITGEGEEKGKETWEKLCKEYGKDPADEQIEGDPVFHLALGALQAPAEPLTTLIAVSALIERRVGTTHMQKLIKRLHPDPEDLNVERLQKTIEELVTKAAHTATLVRGGKVGAGRPHPIQPHEQAAAALINVLQREGWSEDRIIRTVNELHAPPGEEFSDEDIDRLKTLHLNRGYW
jgi:hypothetical protein